MDTITGAKPDSPTGNGVKTPSGEGQSPLSLDTLIDGKPLKNVIAEAARKLAKEEVDQVRSEYDDRINEVLQERLKSLTGQGNGDDPVNKILSDPKFDPWLKVNQKISKETAQVSSNEQNQADALEWVEDKALELGVDPKQFEAEIFQIVKGNWSDLRATSRVRKAYQEWKKQAEIKKSLAELDELKKRHPISGEGGNSRVSTKSLTLKEELDQAKQTGNWTDYLKKVHEAQEKERANA